MTAKSERICKTLIFNAKWRNKSRQWVGLTFLNYIRKWLYWKYSYLAANPTDGLLQDCNTLIGESRKQLCLCTGVSTTLGNSPYLSAGYYFRDLLRSPLSPDRSARTHWPTTVAKEDLHPLHRQRNQPQRRYLFRVEPRGKQGIYARLLTQEHGQGPDYPFYTRWKMR
jgi:hypothetical protein